MLAGASLGLLSLGCPVAAAAQAPARDTAASAVEELVVTARRRDELLQEVPVAVTAASGQQLEARSIRAISEVAAFTPNLRISEASRGGSIASVSLRGQENPNQTIANDPAVGIYFDEIYMARSSGPLFTGLQDMALVQVLRGNQGTLFGRNNTGGAIVLTPNRPNLEEIEGSVRVGLGNFHRREFAGVLSVPLVEGKLGVRASFQDIEQDGTARSFTTGIGDFGDRDRYNGRVSLRFVPVDDLTIDLTYDFAKIDEAGSISTNLSAVLPPGSGFYVSLTGLVPATQFKGDGLTLRTQWDLMPQASLKVIAGYRHMSFADRRDVDGLAAPLVDAALIGAQNQFSTEVQLSGSIDLSETGFLKGFDYTTGVFYFTEQGSNRSQVPYFSIPYQTGRTTPNSGENSSIAAYGQVEAHLADRTSAWLGGRYTKDERSLEVQAFLNGACSLNPRPATCLLRGETDDSYASWSVGLRHKLSEDVNLYVRAARGQRAGGLDDTPTSIESFEPEILTDYEFGIKAELFSSRLKTNLAVFWGDYENIQRTTLLVDANNVPYTSVFNAAVGTVSGVELEATFLPVRRLLLQASLGYLDAKYKEFVDTRPGATRGADASGNKFPYVSKWSFSLSGEYTFDLGGAGEVTARADYSWRSKFPYEVYNSPLTEQPSIGLLNARLTFRPDVVWGRIRPEVAIYGKNLADKKYNAAATSSATGVVFWRTDQRRMFGVDLTARF